MPPQSQGGHGPPVGVDDGRDARIGDAHQGHALLYGAQAGGGEVLVGPRRTAEPTIVREIEKPPRTLARTCHPAWKDDLVADQWAKRRQAWQAQGRRPGAGRKIGSPLGQFGEAEKAAQRHVFAERHQVGLIVGGDHPASGIDGMKAVPDPVRLLAPRRDTGRAGNRDATPWGRPANEPQRLDVVGKGEGHHGLAPNHVGRRRPARHRSGDAHA